MNEFGVDKTYEAFVADVHPKFKKTGCSAGEALFAQRHPLCPERIGYPESPNFDAGRIDHCNLHAGICLRETGIPCEVYTEFLNKVKEK